MRKMGFELPSDSPVLLNALGDSLMPGPIPVQVGPDMAPTPGRVRLLGINQDNGAFIFQLELLEPEDL